MSERIDFIKRSLKRADEKRENLEMSDMINILEQLMIRGEFDWLSDQGEQNKQMTELVKYHKEQQKKAEDLNEPYRHENKRYRERELNIESADKIISELEEEKEKYREALIDVLNNDEMNITNDSIIINALDES